MKTFFLVLKIWLIGLLILTPTVLCFCKAAKKGDEGNKLIEDK